MSEQIKPTTAEESETPVSGLLLSVEPLPGGASYQASASDDTDADSDSQDTSDADDSDAEESDADGSDAADADGTDTGADADGTDPLGIASDGQDK